jgi:uncharacterized membrane protein YraQ (UPF0718 family)
MRPEITTIVLAVLAVAFAVVAYLKDPGLPWIGAWNGLSMLWFVLPRLIPTLILPRMLRVPVPPEVVSRHLGRQGGLRGILIAFVAGILTPGGPMVTVPFLVAPANSDAAMAGWLVKTFYRD